MLVKNELVAHSAVPGVRPGGSAPGQNLGLRPSGPQSMTIGAGSPRLKAGRALALPKAARDPPAPWKTGRPNPLVMVSD